MFCNLPIIFHTCPSTLFLSLAESAGSSLVNFLFLKLSCRHVEQSVLILCDGFLPSSVSIYCLKMFEMTDKPRALN